MQVKSLVEFPNASTAFCFTVLLFYPAFAQCNAEKSEHHSEDVAEKHRVEMEKHIADKARNFPTDANGSCIVDSILSHPSKRQKRQIGTIGEFFSPKPIDKSAVKFLLYNLQNRKIGQPLDFKSEVRDTMWIPGQNAVFVIHGFMQSGKDESAIPQAGKTSENIKNAYIESKRSENIVLVSWEAKSREEYFAAAKDTFLVGEALATMIISLKNRKYLQYSQVKIIGFSLGAHIAGVAGFFINLKLNTKIAEITGLDPAGPAFEEERQLQYRLDPSDADFVQAIHCNMGTLFSFSAGGYLGSTLIMGHVDFFPNGGSVQPGCDATSSATFNSGDYTTKYGVLFVVILFGQICRLNWCQAPSITPCSHSKCCQLYASTVRGRQYQGCECFGQSMFMSGQCTVCKGPMMGDLCPTNATGKYFMIAHPNAEDKLDD